MDLIDTVHGAKQIGLPGAWRAPADIHASNGALTAQEYGTSSGVLQVGVVTGLKPRHGSDSLVQEALREVAWSRTKETPRSNGAQFAVKRNFLAVSVISDPSGGAVVTFVPSAHPSLEWMAGIF